MLKLLRTSIRRKFLAATIGTSLAALTIAAAALLIYDLSEYRRSSIEEIGTLAEVLGLASAPALMFRDPPSAEKVLQLLRAQPRVVAGRILDSRGEAFASYDAAKGPAAGKTLAVGSAGYAIEGGMIAISVPIVESGEPLGSVFLQSRYELDTRLAQYFGVLVAVTLVSLVVALLLSIWLRRTLTEPIVTLADATRRVVNDRDFSQRVRKTSEDELGELVESFNEMMAEVGRHSQALENSNRALGREVAERTAAEAALREADRRKDEFIAVLSHELRNPLSPIRNAVALMKARELDPLTEKARDIIDRQSHHLARLIDDLMDASRISQGKMELRLAQVTVAKVVNMAVESAQGQITSKKQSLEVRLPDEPVWLHADAARIAQVLGNLLNNASKYTDDGGHLAIEAQVGEGSVTIAVTDDGIGIPQDAQEDLFRMFSQIKAHRSRAGGGLGIGLALAKALVEKHNGRIEVQSAGPGQGSRFVVTLPASQVGEGSATERPASPGSAPAQHPLSILVADDVRDSVDSLSELLSGYGHKVTIARDGLEAFSQAARHRPDLAVLDIGMPGIDGYEVARRLRAEPWGWDMTLIALTGWGQREDQRAVRAAGYDFHMTKPTDVGRLLELVGQAASERNKRRNGAGGS
jgi:signal transduction histidine kinase/ActR/RegA family two-component response regulator